MSARQPREGLDCVAPGDLFARFLDGVERFQEADEGAGVSRGLSGPETEAVGTDGSQQRFDRAVHKGPERPHIEPDIVERVVGPGFDGCVAGAEDAEAMGGDEMDVREPDGEFQIRTDGDCWGVVSHVG